MGVLRLSRAAHSGGDARLQSVGYYRLGQRYVRRRVRQGYPRVRGPVVWEFAPDANQVCVIAGEVYGDGTLKGQLYRDGTLKGEDYQDYEQDK